jgi:hypothetical protein
LSAGIGSCWLALTVFVLSIGLFDFLIDFFLFYVDLMLFFVLYRFALASQAHVIAGACGLIHWRLANLSEELMVHWQCFDMHFHFACVGYSINCSRMKPRCRSSDNGPNSGVVSLFAELTALGCQSGKSNWSFEFLRLVV